MSNIYYDNFLSNGFADLNQGSFQHIVHMYHYNYRELLPKDKESAILDIGCGMGHFLTFLGEAGYANIKGVDVSSEAIAYCKDRGIAKVELIEDLRQYLTVAPMYDMVVMNDVIEHIPKDDVLVILKMVREKLRPGGTVIVKTGNLASLVGLRIRYNDFTHETGFTEYSLNQVLRMVGFNDVVIQPYVFPKNSITRIIRFIGQKIIHALWKGVFFFEYTQVPVIVDEVFYAIAKKNEKN